MVLFSWLLWFFFCFGCFLLFLNYVNHVIIARSKEDEVLSKKYVICILPLLGGSVVNLMYNDISTEYKNTVMNYSNPQKLQKILLLCLVNENYFGA